MRIAADDLVDLAYELAVLGAAIEPKEHHAERAAAGMGARTVLKGHLIGVHAFALRRDCGANATEIRRGAATSPR